MPGCVRVYIGKILETDGIHAIKNSTHDKATRLIDMTLLIVRKNK